MGESDEIILDECDDPPQSVDLPLHPKPAAHGTVIVSRKPKQTEVAENWDDDLSSDNDNETDTSGETDKNIEDVRNENPQAAGQGSNVSEAFLENEGLLQVLRAFRMLQEDFNSKFRSIWA